jgi:hypothetical protein
LNVTVLAELDVASKLAPLIVTCAPGDPVAGERLEIVGGDGVTVNVGPLTLPAPATLRPITPVVVPWPTCRVMVVVVAAEINCEV